MKNCSRSLVIGVLFCGCPQDAWAQIPDAFDPQPDGSVHGLALQPDQKILLVGVLRNVGGQAHDHIARVYPGGALDTDFTTSVPGPFGGFGALQSFAVQPDGRILIGGNFESINQEARLYIGRVHPNGSLDNSFTIGANGTRISIRARIRL